MKYCPFGHPLGYTERIVGIYSHFEDVILCRTVTVGVTKAAVQRSLDFNIFDRQVIRESFPEKREIPSVIRESFSESESSTSSFWMEKR
jgi:hypothetical protein